VRFGGIGLAADFKGKRETGPGRQIDHRPGTRSVPFNAAFRTDLFAIGTDSD
jgi:hypothetical protein